MLLLLLRAPFVVKVAVMMGLSSTGELLSALQSARDVSLIAYTLPSGRVLDGLVSAAKSGARVRVRLEGYIYKDDGTVSGANAAAIAALRAAGADARLVHPDAKARDAMLHCKAALVDGTLFLDDRNWPDDGADTIVRDDFASDAQIVRDAVAGREDAPTPFFAVAKRESLASEARLLHEAHRGDDVILESESFGADNRVYAALDAAGRAGAHVRLLVSARDLQGNANERGALEKLARDGVAVRVCDDDEKFAVVEGTRGWLGSSNATAAFDHPDQIDWGARTDAPPILDHLRQAFEQRWATASDYTACGFMIS
ncbi:MAG TPA: phospholipase D-like domain-containing protein [Candidatus Acidoferrales bacterium]|nr:phospholipase D-like domain-containing protein [Candidatus Acidoferrales bacterium]